MSFTHHPDQGVLVFVVLVCKKKTVKRVASRVRGQHSSTYPSTSRYNSTYSHTTRWLTYII